MDKIKIGRIDYIPHLYFYDLYRRPEFEWIHMNAGGLGGVPGGSHFPGFNYTYLDHIDLNACDVFLVEHNEEIYYGAIQNLSHTKPFIFVNHTVSAPGFIIDPRIKNNVIFHGPHSYSWIVRNQHYEGKEVVIKPLIDRQRWATSHDWTSKKVVCSTNYLPRRPECGCSVFEEVVAESLVSRPDITFVLVGAEGEHYAQRYANVQATGFLPQEQMRDLFSTACLYFSPATESACPMALQEAAAAGMPLVALDVTDQTLMVNHGVNGFKGTSSHELAAMIAQLVDASPDVKMSMGVESLKLSAAMNDPDVNAALWCDFLHDCIRRF